MIWSIVVLAGIVTLRKRWGDIRDLVRSPRSLGLLCVTTLLIANNWYLYIWAVVNDHVLEASLGYFISPLLNALLGVIFLKERLRPVQTIGLLIAATGVGFLAFTGGPAATWIWITLALPLSFGFYVLLRKRSRADAITGLTIEVCLLLPAAMAYLAYLSAIGENNFISVSPATTALLICAGAVTTFPLLWFTEAARRLRMVTLGILQYLAPTGQFLLGVLLYREPMTSGHTIAFVCIWSAVIVYTIDSIKAARRKMALEGPEVRPVAHLSEIEEAEVL